MKYELHSTTGFNKWFSKIKDAGTRRKILARFARVENGKFGDFKKIYANLFELRFFFGGGLRIYYTIRDSRIVLLLVGSDKSNQQNDIQRAKRLLDEME